MNNQTQLLSVRQVSNLLGIGVATIWRQVKKDNFPKPIKVGGSTRWRRADIEALFATDAA